MMPKYTEEVTALHDQITEVTTKLDDISLRFQESMDNLTDTITNLHLADSTKERQRREDRACELAAANAQLTASITTSLETSLRAVFTELLPQLRAGRQPPGPAPQVNIPPPHRDAPRPVIKFPVFSGEDPDGWIFNADQYFSVYTAEDDLKIIVASAHLKGEANQ